MNMQSLMAQAQKMQRDLTKKKEEIDNTIFTGESEWVTVEMNGKKELKNIKIKFEGTIEEDDKEALEDMIKIAVNNATVKIDKEIESKMGGYGSALNGLF
ncbi:MAG: YbaB/EbfC family nucleoid-associated protein [Firmicutes bacterium]|nr:YbaB/EbfC family nucleoid-associated protein [Bacillota bacterium]